MTWPGPVFPEAAAWQAVQDGLLVAELSDGLPCVPPTTRRLAAMLADQRAPDFSHGLMPPLMGDLTARAVAYQCVLAGCSPGTAPLVLAAAKACLAPEFNLLGLLTTTGTPAIATIVHGPLAKALGLNAGANCLGPGNPANATIGRAIALVLRNVGGARPGVGDMATMGQPGKYTFCFAEGEPAAGFPPALTARGFEAGDSAVTVLGVSGTVEVLPINQGDSPQAILDPLVAAMAGATMTGSPARPRELGEQTILLPPEMVGRFVKFGWALDQVQDYLYQTRRVEMPGIGTITTDRPPARTPDDIHVLITGGAGIKMTYLPPWAGGTESVTCVVEAVL